ncbi:universal stress protein [Chitinophaga oryzae]|uniref:Universal stress protein n=1 Tax=Chitinophaga oryzae TaxID=2725414 RepID=A0AAE6ZGL0_9BACT|nr:universal stress protein [Chitinophaga oryzae]QJB31837.1 universal stress protein [Chitinophaga oryzae]QJB38315.1 universal stress protein [Chitinophaga oryzae]
MKTIVVATDFSAAALNAAYYATDMAKATGKQVLLLHVYTLPVSYAEVPVAFNADQLMQDIQQELDKLQALLAERVAGAVVVNTLLKIGTFYTELKAVCDQEAPYLVVMGSQGTTAAERMLLGSHAVAAMKNLPWPLITVPPACTFNGIKKMGLACDLDEVAATVPVSLLELFVIDFRAELHVLNIKEKREHIATILQETSALYDMLEPLRPEYHYSVHPKVVDSITEAVDELGLDLLIVLPKRHDWLYQLTHTSHTKQLTLRSPVPVMALQASER